MTQTSNEQTPPGPCVHPFLPKITDLVKSPQSFVKANLLKALFFTPEEFAKVLYKYCISTFMDTAYIFAISEAANSHMHWWGDGEGTA